MILYTYFFTKENRKRRISALFSFLYALAQKRNDVSPADIADGSVRV